jgi:hypothetical protein
VLVQRMQPRAGSPARRAPLRPLTVQTDEPAALLGQRDRDGLPLAAEDLHLPPLGAHGVGWLSTSKVRASAEKRACCSLRRGPLEEAALRGATETR